MTQEVKKEGESSIYWTPSVNKNIGIEWPEWGSI